MESNLDPDEDSNLDPDGAESVAELVYSELGLSQELVDLRVREDMGEEVYVLKHSHSSQQCPGGHRSRFRDISTQLLNQL